MAQGLVPRAQHTAQTLSAFRAQSHAVSRVTVADTSGAMCPIDSEYRCVAPRITAPVSGKVGLRAEKTVTPRGVMLR